MDPCNPSHYQYHTFDHLYLFKMKNSEKITLKVYDISRKCLFKQTFSPIDIGIPRLPLSGEQIHCLLNFLVAKEFIPSEYGPRSLIIQPTECQKELNKLLDLASPPQEASVSPTALEDREIRERQRFQREKEEKESYKIELEPSQREHAQFSAYGSFPERSLKTSSLHSASDCEVIELHGFQREQEEKESAVQ